MDDNNDSGLSTALTEDSDTGSGDQFAVGATSQPNTVFPEAGTPEPAPDIGAAPPVTGPSNLAAAVSQPQAPDLPRFQRTFGNTLKGILLGFTMGNIPGAIQGGFDPQAPQRALELKRATAEANQHFASARAAHETQQAALLEKQVNSWDEEHQQQMEKIGLENLKAAQDAGFSIVSVTPLDGDPADNSKAAMNNLQQIQKNNGGQVPEGLLHIHAGNGNGIYTLQLANPADALPAINQMRQAQGQPAITSEIFGAMADADRKQMAKDAVNFTLPTGPNGQITQDSVTTLENRMALVQAQPGFNGKDQMVANLQKNLEFQKSALEHQATRKGQATGAEALAAQPGQTAAKVAEINATAGPEAAAAGKKAMAELPAKLALQKEEHQDDQGFAFNPKTGQRELVSKGDAAGQGFTNWVKAGQPDVEKETSLNSQMNDMQLNTSRYRASLNAMSDLSASDRANIQRIVNAPDIKGLVASGIDLANFEAQGGGTLSQRVALSAGKAWNELAPDKQDAVIGYLRMKNTALLAQKVLTGMGRASKEAMDIEIANMPSPSEGATIGNKKLDAWQENLDQMNARSVKLPWMESPLDVRKRVEGQAAEKYNATQAAKPQGQFRSRPGETLQPGQTVTVTLPGNRIASKIVSAVHPDGTFDIKP